MSTFFYGSYYHPANSVAFRNISRTFTRGQTQRQWMLHVSWQLEGKIVQPTQALIWAELNSMMAAYIYDGQSAGMLDNNGQVTPFTINSQLAIGGVRVTSPVSHESVRGADGVTYLRYTIGLEADFPYAAATDLLTFQESLSFTNNNGGPIYIERIPAIGAPILQQVSTQSWFYVTQQGSLSQPGANPNPVPPIFPLQYIRTANNNGQQVTYTSPKTIQGTPIEYGVNWRYEYISPTPLIGWPSVLG